MTKKIFTICFAAILVSTNFYSQTSPDEGMTSETHKANIGKIVFSKSHILQGKENPAEFQTSFSGNDLIYARCYMPKSLYNMPLNGREEASGDVFTSETQRNFDCWFTIEIYIDGKPTKEFPALKKPPYDQGYGRRYFILFIADKPETEKAACSLPYGSGNSGAGNPVDERKKKTTFELYLNTSKEEKTSLLGSEWPLIANALSPGEHTIKLVLRGESDGKINFSYGSKDPICIGEFKYVKKPGDYVSYGRDFVTLNKKSFMKDPVLEAQLKKVVESFGDKPEDKVKVIKLGINQDQWSINKDYKGVIEFRAISIWFVAKDPAGFCQMGYMNIRELYNGKTYSEPKAYGNSSAAVGGADYVDCTSVK